MVGVIGVGGAIDIIDAIDDIGVGGGAGFIEAYQPIQVKLSGMCENARRGNIFCLQMPLIRSPAYMRREGGALTRRRRFDKKTAL